MAATTNVMRTQLKRQMAAGKKAAKGHAKGKVLKGPALKTLKIRA